MPLLLYAFCYKSSLTGKCVKARYRAELHEIRERYAEFELIGDPEILRAHRGRRHDDGPRRASGQAPAAAMTRT